MPYEPDHGWINGDHLAVVNSRFGKSTERLQADAHIEVDDGRQGIEQRGALCAYSSASSLRPTVRQQSLNQ